MPPIARAEALKLNAKLAAESVASATFQNVACRMLGAAASSVSTASVHPAGAATVGAVGAGVLVTTVATMTSPLVRLGPVIESAPAGAAVFVLFAARNTIAPCAGAGSAAATPHAHAATIARTLTPA